LFRARIPDAGTKRERAHPDELTAEADLARSTVEWHLSALLEYDLATKEYEGRAVSVRLTQPKLLRGLLVEIDPSLPDRRVDRFSKLVDSPLKQ
jgi:DNA-binding transcriptional ArsR family regulator